MSTLDPSNTTVGDICLEALKEANVVGFAQTALAGQIVEAQARLQWMLQEWARKRWLIYHLVTLNVVSTGALSYTVGPGGQIDTGVGSSRPDKIESAFVRQLTQSQPNQIDYPLNLLQSMEDYNRIQLKQLQSFPAYVFYDPGFPLGSLYGWPVAQVNIYALYVTLKAQLPTSFANLAVKLNLPYEYYLCMLYNLAIRMRARYNIPSFPGDALPGLAKNSLATVRGANTAIARLQTDVPARDQRGSYIIFSDTGT